MNHIGSTAGATAQPAKPDPLAALSEDELLLRETVNLMGAEVAAVLCSLRIGGLGGVSEKGDDVATLRRYATQAIRRLEANAEYLSLLVQEPGGLVRVDRLINRLVRALAAGCDVPSTAAIHFALERITAPGHVARRLNLIAAEMVGNAFRHALEAGGSILKIILHRVPDAVTLSVIDNGPGCSLDRPLGSGQGLRLASELAKRSNGWLFCESSPFGSLVKVRLPLA